jgi:hypothetical protein
MWESQSTTSADSRTGQRYQHHREQGSQVLSRARVRDTDPAFWVLGPCEYMQHRGRRPMAVTWRLRHLMPADLFHEFSAAVA